MQFVFMRRSSFKHAGSSYASVTKKASSQCSRNACANAIARPHTEAAVQNQSIRNGGSETELVEFQAKKSEQNQSNISTYLQVHNSTKTFDVCVVGCGPAGLALSSELGNRGLSVCLVGPESKFTNNYGVWVDEFRNIGLEHLLDVTWDKSLCYFSDSEKLLDRAYGRVDRAALRHHLLSQCRDAGVTYVPALVTGIEAEHESHLGMITTSSAEARTLQARLITLAGGAVSSKFLKFEAGAPPVAVQTAYGITARVSGYSDAYDPKAMIFMDYRRAHSGIWDSVATKLQPLSAAKTQNPGEDLVHHPNWDAEIGTAGEAPSFLYAMPLEDGTVFLEETCLVARPTVPFSDLKRRLERRCRAMGIVVEEVRSGIHVVSYSGTSNNSFTLGWEIQLLMDKISFLSHWYLDSNAMVNVLDEEYSYIPVGGPMPMGNQSITAFGAAANLIHPATGYSIARMLHEVPPMASAIVDTLSKNQTIGECSSDVWEALWPQEKRTQAAFHVFGMELLTTLEIKSIHQFFDCFFRLPDYYWRGFLASRLTSGELLVFAFLTFVYCTGHIRSKLMSHLFTNASGSHMINSFLLLVGVGQPPISSEAKSVD